MTGLGGRHRKGLWLLRNPAADYIPGVRRRRIELTPYHAALIVCAAALAGLVYAEGWIWPLRFAAVMIPVSFLVG
jgi:hypothetical protein